MSYAVITFIWSNRFAVPTEKLSAFLKILDESIQVESYYLEEESGFYKVKPTKPRIELIDKILAVKPEKSEV